MNKLDSLKPDEVVALIRKKIREYFGDAAENYADIYAARGYYFVHVNNISYKGRRRHQLAALFKAWRKESQN